jgi:hypothetical protein
MEQKKILNTDPNRTGGWGSVMVADGISHPGLPV